MAVDHQRIHSLFRKLERQLTRLSEKPQPQSVHRFRTSARRVQTVLDELVPKPDRNQRRLLKQLARIRRRAGRLRDLDVQIAALRSLKMSEEPGRKTQLLRTLLDLRAKREKKLCKSLDAATVREIRKRLKRARAALDSQNQSFNPLARALLMFARVSSAQATLGEEVLHKYRLAGKRIRYIAELDTDLDASRPVITRLQRMQDVLGDWHDWLTLTGTVKKLAVNVPHSALLAAVNNITRAKLREAIQVVAETKAALLPATGAKKIPASSPAVIEPGKSAVQSATAAA